MRIAVSVMILMALWLSTAVAGSYQQIMAVQHAQLYGDKITLPEASRDQVVSEGQDYLRNMLREQMLKSMPRSWLNGTWLISPDEQMHAGVETNLTRQLWGAFLPMDTVLRVYADDDINHYLTCGWNLPVEMEMETTYEMNNNLKFNAKVEAPFDNLLKVQLGSEMTWANGITSHFTYSLSNGSDSYEGLSFALGINLAPWKLKFNYDMDAHFTQLNYLSLARRF